jgi:hypothetical protein
MNWVQIVISAIVGASISTFFWSISRKRRELVYSINAVRTRVVASGQTKDLKVLYKDEPLGDVNITAVQISLGNTGNESISTTNILEEVKIKTEPPARILEAYVRNKTRDVIGITLLDSAESRSKGTIPLSWRILEKNDGFSVQLLYLGKQTVDVLIDGIIEGKREIKRQSISSGFESPEKHKKELLVFGLISILSLFVLVGSLITYTILKNNVNLFGPIVALSFYSLIFSGAAFTNRKRRKYPPLSF